MKKRLNQDDFVVDDGVGGYNDHGTEDWDMEDSDSQWDSHNLSNKNKTSGPRVSIHCIC